MQINGWICYTKMLMEAGRQHPVYFIVLTTSAIALWNILCLSAVLNRLNVSKHFSNNEQNWNLYFVMEYMYTYNKTFTQASHWSANDCLYVAFQFSISLEFTESWRDVRRMFSTMKRTLRREIRTWTFFSILHIIVFVRDLTACLDG